MLKFLFVFTVFCRPGVIYEYGDTKQYQGYPSTELEGGNSKKYSFYELEYPSGAYLYVSNKQDTVWFYVEGDEVNYIYYSKVNSEFEIK